MHMTEICSSSSRIFKESIIGEQRQLNEFCSIEQLRTGMTIVIIFIYLQTIQHFSD
jgi:hypothetical protein